MSDTPDNKKNFLEVGSAGKIYDITEIAAVMELINEGEFELPAFLKIFLLYGGTEVIVTENSDNRIELSTAPEDNEPKIFIDLENKKIAIGRSTRVIVDFDDPHNRLSPDAELSFYFDDQALQIDSYPGVAESQSILNITLLKPGNHLVKVEVGKTVAAFTVETDYDGMKLKKGQELKIPFSYFVSDIVPEEEISKLELAQYTVSGGASVRIEQSKDFAGIVITGEQAGNVEITPEFLGNDQTKYFPDSVNLEIVKDQ